MEGTEHRVAIVVDPDYGDRIAGLARDCHTWAVRSEANEAVFAALRQGDPVYSLETGVTVFNSAETPEAAFLSILGAVEEHHGEHSHDPPLSIIEVVGLEPSAAVRDELGSYGFDHVEPSENGFVARRDWG